MQQAASAANPASLAQALVDAVRGLPWDTVRDAATGGRLGPFPSIDLALVAFPPGRAPVAANVLFSREHPGGHVAEIAPDFGPVRGLRRVADVRDDAGLSLAWQPGADWRAIDFPPLQGDEGPRFVAPYPASLLKLMVAVGAAWMVDAGRCAWDAPVADRQGRRSTLAEACEAMITVSDDDATEACVAALHAHGEIGPGRHELHRLFAALGLATLRLDGTTPGGGWRNPDGAGVGRLQMTAWDSARLLWWLDRDAPPPPWLGPQAPRLAPETLARLRGWLAGQALHEVLSSTVLAGVPGWVPGLPAALPARWVDPEDGSVAAGPLRYPGDVRATAAAAEVDFDHKTGTTENYASDAGIVRGRSERRRHYIVALITSLGRRYAPRPPCASSWCLPMLGARIDALMADWMEHPE